MNAVEFVKATYNPDDIIAVGATVSFMYIGRAGDFESHISKLDKYEKDVLIKRIRNKESEIKGMSMYIQKLGDLTRAAQISKFQDSEQLAKDLQPVVGPYILKATKHKEYLKRLHGYYKKQLDEYVSIGEREVIRSTELMHIQMDEPERYHVII